MEKKQTEIKTPRTDKVLFEIKKTITEEQCPRQACLSGLKRAIEEMRDMEISMIRLRRAAKAVGNTLKREQLRKKKL